MTDLNAAEIAALAVDAYDAGNELAQGLPPGFVRLAITSPGADDLGGAAYYNAATGELVVAYVGSESLRALFTNFSLIESTASDTALNRALSFLDMARDAVLSGFGIAVADSDIVLTGHGVGGGFASLVSVATGLAATTFNGTRIGALMSAMESRFGPLDASYADRIVNYVLDGEEVWTMPRGAEQIGVVNDVAASDLTFYGQLSTSLGTPTLGATVMDSIYDWLAADSADRQRAQRTLMALELEFGAVGSADPADPTRDQMLTEQLNQLIQTSYSDVLRTRTFDRLLVDGSDAGQVQDAAGHGLSNDLLIGATGADRLAGGDGADVLFGGDGNDVLDGGAGQDLLFGGAGADLYALGAGAAEDSITDSQGVNRLTVDGRGAGGAYFADGDGGWRSADGHFGLESQAGRVVVTQGGARVGLEGFADGQFGIRRLATRAVPTGATIVGDWDLDGTGDYSDSLNGTSAGETIQAGAGFDRVTAGGGNDVVFGGAETDQLYGGAGDDWLYGSLDAALADVIGQLDPGSGLRGDWLGGNEGDDVLVGTALDDVLSGGGGTDVLVGGAGRDFLFGDADYTARSFSWTIAVKADGRTDLAGNAALDNPASSAADIIYAGAGNDYVSAGHGDDSVYGGDGDDLIFGNAGADTLYGERGRDALHASDRTGAMDRSEDFLDGGDDNDTLYSSDGSNILLGGRGNDIIYSGAGDDYIDGGEGDDTIYASIGADVVYGGAGDDTVTAFSTVSLVLDGGEGNDLLQSDLAADTLRGGGGNDVLIGKEGDDLLDGGAGDDTYRFFLGDGVDSILDGGGADTIEIVSDASGAVTRDRIRLVADESEIWLAYGDGGDRIRLGSDPRGLVENVALRTVNGSVETVENWALDSMRVTLDGSASGEALFAVMGFVNAIQGGDGRDVLFGGDLDDLLDGGAGDDLLKGGEGADRYTIGFGAGLDTVSDDGLQGLDAIDFAVSASAATLGLLDGALFIDLGAGAGVKIVGFQAENAEASVAIERFRFADGTLDATALLGRGFDIVGSDQARSLTGTSVSDRFAARSGNERLLGGRGNDTYTFGRGFGRDVVVDQDTTAGNFDRVVFSDGIKASDVTVRAADDRLLLEVNGTQDVLEIQWVPTQGARIESIEFADSTWDLAAIQARFAPVNARPGVVNPIVDQAVKEDAPFSFAVPAGTFRDPDAGDTLTLSAALADGSALPDWLSFRDGMFSGTPGNDDVGRVTVRVTALDGGGATVFDEFDIGVENVNDAPTLAAPLPDAELLEDSSFAYTVPAGAFADVDRGDTLRYLATLEQGGRLPAWLAFDERTGTFSGTPGNEDVGVLAVRVIAIDGSGAMAEDWVNLVVLNENDAPELAAPLADAAGREGHLLEVEIPADTFRDIDRGDALTFSATLASGEALPPWLVYDAEEGVLRGAPTRADIGSYTVRLTATDSEGASAFDEFVVAIEAVPGMTLTGGSGDDVLTGDAGDDSLAGRAGQDLLIGNAGDDRFLWFRDALWGDAERRTNLGSPESAGTGESASIGRRTRSYDVFVGGDGLDTLQGTSAADAILLDDVLSPAAAAGPRLQSIEVILAGRGNDVVDLTSASHALGSVRVEGGAGGDVIWSSGGDDILLGGSGADRIFGGAGDDYLAGEGGGDDLNGGLGIDVLQGDLGNDRLIDGAGANVLDGRGGADQLLDGAANAFVVGGRGSDRITLGGGFDVVAFNRGDGRDVIRGEGAATLSLGGGIRYDQLGLRASGADLVVELGANERITLLDWYGSPDHRSVLDLQVIAEVMQGYEPGGANALLDDRVERFDFGAIVDRFDADRAQQPLVGRWMMMNALLDAHLGGSDAAALGGDLAYQYGVNGSLAGIGLGAAQRIVGDAGFGRSTQTLLAPQALGEGSIKLS
jgi:Ca2+-binding RTX toxin-like protein